MTAQTAADARALRDAAKRRLTRTAARVGRKLSPRSVAHEAVDGVRERALAVADDIAAVVRKRPAVVATATALLVAIVAQRWWRRSQERVHATPAVSDSYFADPATPVKGPQR